MPTPFWNMIIEQFEITVLQYHASFFNNLYIPNRIPITTIPFSARIAANITALTMSGSTKCHSKNARMSRTDTEMIVFFIIILLFNLKYKISEDVLYISCMSDNGQYLALIDAAMKCINSQQMDISTEKEVKLGKVSIFEENEMGMNGLAEIRPKMPSRLPEKLLAKFESKTLVHVDPTIDITTYKSYPFLSDRDESFIRRVATIDTSTSLSTAIGIVSYASSIQENIGKLLEQASTVGNRMIGLGLSGTISEIVEILKGLSADNYKGKHKKKLFWIISRNVEWQVKDYVDAYEHAIKMVDNLIYDLQSKAKELNSMMTECDGMFTNTDKLISELDAHIQAGKIILEKNKKKVFKESNEKFLESQFEERLLSLATYENLTLVSFEQVKLTQRNLIHMATQAQNVITVTYPLWKSAFGSLMQKWQSQGKLTLGLPVSEVIGNDSDYVFAEQHSRTLTAALEGNQRKLSHKYKYGLPNTDDGSLYYYSDGSSQQWNAVLIE